jgi:hypothetical protein
MVARINLVGAAAAVLAAVLFAGCGGASKDPGGTRSREQLVRLLAVLRRPQTKADRDATMLRTIDRLAQTSGDSRYGSRPDRPLIRLATVAPWGAKIFLVPFTSPTSEPQCTGTRRACQGFPREETLTVFPTVDPVGWTTDQVDRGFAIARASSNGRWVSVVPDGVSRVTFVLGARKPSVAVRDNVAAVEGHVGERIHAALWYDADGRLLRRVPTNFG